MNASVSVICKILWIFLLISCSQASPVTSQFWAEQIDSALDQRDNYYNSIGIQLDGVAIQNWDYSRKLEALEALDISPSLDNSWYHITRGLIDGSLSDTNQAVFFNRALFLAQLDPGTTWLLFNEFDRNKFYSWADKCLEQLEKLLFQSGAYSSKIISQQLLHLAISYEKSDAQQALRIYRWAQKFDFHQTLSSKRTAWIKFPFDIPTFINEYKSVFFHLKSSWISQLQLATDFYNWFRSLLICFILITVFVLTFKYIPYALHKISDLLPYTVPLYLRAPLVSIIFFSFAVFGIFALLWLSAFLIWKFLTSKEKAILTVSLTILVISPFDSYIQGALFSASNPEGALQTFSRSVNEGYSGDEYETLLTKIEVQNEDYLKTLSAAIYELKRLDFPSATVNIRNANSLCSNDPVILTAAGNLHFLKNDIEKAEIYYRQILTNNNKNAEALFNLAQCQLRKMQTITAAEYISDAAQLKPNFVNAFIHNNEKYFSRNWPQLRQIMFSDLSPHDFWTKHFPHYALSWKTASILWNPTFFSIPPVISLFLLTLFFVILLTVFKNANDYRRMKKTFECRFCGRVICRKCKSGTLCHSCHEATQFMSNENSLEKMRKLISTKAKRINLVRNAIIEILFPGAAQLFEQDISISKVMLSLFITSMVYASYKAVFISLRSYGANQFGLTVLILTALASYNVYFIIKRIQVTIQGFRKLSEK